MIARPQPAPVPPRGDPPLRVAGNVLMGRNALGMWVDAPGGAGDWQHPWRVSVAGNVARIGKGYIVAEVAVEPRIGKTPISGDGKVPAPVLRIEDGAVNSAGETWVCVQVTPDAKGKLGEEAVVEVVQSAHPFVTEGEWGRAPLAVLVKERAAWRVWQVAFFHMRYVVAAGAEGKRRHFFL